MSQVPEDPQVDDASPSTGAASEEAEPFRYFHTNGCAELLQSLGATLLVSTYQAGKLCAFRAADGRLTMLPRTFDKAMGVAASASRMAVATRYQIWFLRNEPILAPRIKPHGRHDACYLPRRSHVTGNIDAHEIAWGGDELWIVNTQFSCLSTLDPDFSFVPRWQPPFVSALARQDRCHLNGLAMKQGRPQYVTAFGETDAPEGWREVKKDGGVVIDVASGEIVARGLAMPHSPRWYAGKLWVLDSGRGRLGQVDLDRGQVETVASLPGYTRGLAFAGRYAFVGLSQIRETAIFGGVPIADESVERNCGVSVVDLGSGQIVAQLTFEKTVQEIFDVQLLPGIRFPAVIGFDKEAIQRASVIAPLRPLETSADDASDPQATASTATATNDATLPPRGARSDERAAAYVQLHQDHADVDAGRVASARKILDWLWPYWTPNSVLDVGCGIGIWLAEARRQGAREVQGIEGPWLDASRLRIETERILRHDLEQPFDLGRRFDLAVCLEVAEHLSPHAADGLVQSLARHSDVILFSAAIPGQGGVDHRNEQWPSYWRDKFAAVERVVLDVVRREFWDDDEVLWWFRQNLLLFVSSDLLRANAKLAELHAERSDLPLDAVHPRLRQLREAAQSVGAPATAPATATAPALAAAAGPHSSGSFQSLDP